MKKSVLFKIIPLFLAFVMIVSCGKNEEPKEGEDMANMEEIQKKQDEFILYAKDLQSKLGVAYTDLAEAYWQAAIEGTDENFAKASETEVTFRKMLADKDVFAKLKEFKESGLIQDDLLKRELLYLYNEYLGNQIDTNKLKEMTELSSEIQKKYQNYRAEVAGKKLTDNEIEQILKTSKDSKKLEEAWKAHKDIGPVVANDIKKLVKMRNEVATDLGFNNYHEMSLKLSDQDPEEITKIFDELDKLTRDAFAELKGEMDGVIAKQCGVSEAELMPWHYQNRYFQEAPQIYDLNLDKYYEDQNLEELTKEYYAGIGMPVDEIIAKSDLYEKENKNQHAFCTDVDRNKKDIRILCNIKPNYSWMNTMLHEFGHGVYFKYQDEALPWILDTPAHIFTTEAIAMLFGRMAANPQWIEDMTGEKVTQDKKVVETAQKIQRLEQLVFSRWAQVMYNFEKSMYANPDQDLNKLWWDLVEKYQMVKAPEGRDMPDWATKTHIANSPCYYHNYLLGELLASQLQNYIKAEILKVDADTPASFKDSKKAGQYLTDNVFKPGARYYWNDMIEKATGEKLTPKYYASQFVD